jgi:hypothetical protein
MRYSTTVGVDLTKNVIQVSVVSGHGKELLNRSLTHRKFSEFLGKQKPALVSFRGVCDSALLSAYCTAPGPHRAHHSGQGGGAIPARPQDR